MHGIGNGNLVISSLREKYNKLPAAASSCTECGVCESRCPFKVKVIDKMKQASILFE